MKILVIDDSEKNQKSAEETLIGHELTIAKSFGEAMKALSDSTFDAVLTDMMMPMDRHKAIGDDRLFKPEEQVAYGFVIALKAVSCGAKFVAMATDLNHHNDALSASLDEIPYEPFSINGAKVRFYHSPMLLDVISEKACDCPGLPPCYQCGGTGQKIDDFKQDRKDWGKILRVLTGEQQY